MAAQTMLAKSALSIKYKDGVDERGNDINKTKKFSNVKVTAVAQNLYDVAIALSPLMRYPILEVVRTDDSVIVNM